MECAKSGSFITKHVFYETPIFVWEEILVITVLSSLECIKGENVKYSNDGNNYLGLIFNITWLNILIKT